MPSKRGNNWRRSNRGSGGNKNQAKGNSQDTFRRVKKAGGLQIGRFLAIGIRNYLAIGGLLVALFAAIWIFMRPEPHYTHFVLFEDETTNPTRLYPNPDFPEEKLTSPFYRRYTSRQTATPEMAHKESSESSPWQRLVNTLEASAQRLGASDLDQQHTIVLFMKLIGPIDEDPRIDITGVGLGAAAEGVSLSLNKIDQLLDRIKKIGIKTLLIVDLPEPENANHLIWAPNGLTNHVLSRASADSGLAVVCAAGNDQFSHTAQLGGGGQTVFAHFVQQGFTTAADENGDENGDISYSEFINFVKSRTDAWVALHRGEGLQNVWYQPPVGETQQSKSDDFLLLRNPPTPKTDLTPDIKSAKDLIDTKYAQVWSEVQKVNTARPWVWRPNEWTTILDKLQKAEHRWLCGRQTDATVLLDDVQGRLKHFKYLKGQGAQFVSGARDLLKTDFEAFPSASYLNIGIANPYSITEVLKANWESWGNVNVPDELVKIRQEAEAAAASSFGSSQHLRKQFLRLERELLKCEDSTFSSQLVMQPDQNKLEELFGQFLQLRLEAVGLQKAEACLNEVLSLAPFLSNWAASSTPEDAELEEKIKSLFEIARDIRSTADSLRELSEDESTDQSRGAILKRLIEFTNAGRKSLRQYQEAAVGAFSELINDDSAELREVALIYTRARRILKLPFWENQRHLLLLKISSLEQALHENYSRENRDRQEDKQRADVQKNKLINAQKRVFWVDQLTSLRADDYPIITLVDLESSTTMCRKATYIRKLWHEESLRLSEAPQSSETNQRVRDISLNSRPMLAENLPQRSDQWPSELKQRLMRNYADLHIERLLIGGWVLPTDKTPLSENENGWYANQISLWDSNEQFDKRVPFDFPVSSRVDSKVVFRVPGKLQFQLGVGQGSRTTRLNVKPELPIATFRLRSITPESQSAVEISPSREQRIDLRSENEVSFDLHRTNGQQNGDCKSIELQAELFVRGRISRATKVTVDPCDGQETTVEITPPDSKAKVLFEDRDMRPIAIVFDCSQSMKEDGGNRWESAKIALLSILDKIPENRRISLRLFGHLTGKSEETGKLALNTDLINQTAELEEKYSSTFTILPRAVKNRSEDNDKYIDDSHCVMTPRPFTRELLNRQLVPFINELDYYGGSPLPSSIKNAIKDELKSSPGVVVVITDGDLDPEKRRELVSEIRKATLVDVVIVAVGSEAAKLKNIDGSQFFFSDQSKLAAKSIREKTEKRNLKLKPSSLEGQDQIIERKETEVSEGEYQLLFPDAPEKTEVLQSVFLSGGVMIRPRIKWGLTRPSFVFSNEVYKDSFATAVRVEGRERVSAQLVTEGGVYGKNINGQREVQTTLVLHEDDESNPTRCPSEIEFAFSEQEDTAPVRHNAKIRFLPRINEPGWHINLPSWPQDRRLWINAWWKNEPTVPEYTLAYRDIYQGSPGAQARSLEKKRIQLNGLPPMYLTSTTRPNELQVRLDPVTTLPVSENPVLANSIANVMVSLGTQNTEEGPENFNKIRVKSDVIYNDDGSVIFDFKYGKDNKADQPLKHVYIGLTTLAKRRNGAITLEEPLEVVPSQ